MSSTPRQVNLEQCGLIEGLVVRLPAPGIPNGRSLVLRLNTGETVSIPASAKSGWTVLERALLAERVHPGDRVALVRRRCGTRRAAGRFFRATRAQSDR
jgi:hypothetical protein